ncbi:hypothetical protein ENUP19_0180G0013 [Entamoeba nuttalli]|uniref:RING-type domain-containing protein n=1 Tax=Entamoeba nuttalli TaxID=412467 RepID=A0ABQ0DMW6_9EUKA
MSIEEELIVSKTLVDLKCPICLEIPNPKEMIEHNTCGKLFCKKCLYQWWDIQRMMTCPFCRGEFTNSLTIKHTSRCLYSLLMKQEIRCPFSKKCGTTTTFETLKEHQLTHHQELMIDNRDERDDDYFEIDQINPQIIKSSVWVNPNDQISESSYSFPVIIKWICELTPWEILIFPQGVDKIEEKCVSVFIGATNSVKRRVIVEIELRQDHVTIRKKAKHYFEPYTGRPGFMHFCSSSELNFNKPIQCLLTIEYQ